MTGPPRIRGTSDQEAEPAGSAPKPTPAPMAGVGNAAMGRLLSSGGDAALQGDGGNRAMAALLGSPNSSPITPEAIMANLPPKARYVFQQAAPGVGLSAQNYGPILRIGAKADAMDLADLENYLRNGTKAADLDALETSIDTFLAAKVASGDKLKELMRQTAAGEWGTDDTAAGLDSRTMFYLPLADRLRVIKEIAGGNLVGDEDEQTIIRLLGSTPAGDLPQLVAALKSGGSELLKKLESVVDGAENKQYYMALRQIIFGSMQPGEALARMKQAKILPWADPGLFKAVYNVRFKYETVEYTDDGRVRVVYWTNIAMIGMRNNEQIFQPDEIIGLHFFADEEFANASAGETIFMPAANLITFANEQFGRELGLVVDIGLLAAGGAGLLAKGTRLAKVIAALDTAIAAAALTISSFRQDIAKTPAGKSFLYAWDTVQTLIAVYGLARIVLHLPETFRNLRKAYEEFKAGAKELPPASLGKIDDETTKLIDKAEEAITADPLDELRTKYPAERLAPFEKQLEKAAGITDATKQQKAAADIESQISAQQHNQALVKELKGSSPEGTSNREIADKAAPRIQLPNVPMGMDAEEFERAQAYIRKFLKDRGVEGAEGFVTGSRVTGVTFNPKKTTFGLPGESFAGKDLDITLITKEKISNSAIRSLEEGYAREFRHPLGVRNVSDPETLKNIPVFGKIELDLK